MDPTTLLSSPPKPRQKSQSIVHRAGSKDFSKDNKAIQSFDFFTRVSSTMLPAHNTTGFPKSPGKMFEISPTNLDSTPDSSPSTPQSGSSTPVSLRREPIPNPKSPFTRIKALVFNRVPSDETDGSSGMFGNRTNQRIGMTTPGPKVSTDLAALGPFDLQVELYPTRDGSATDSENPVITPASEDSFITAPETATSTGTLRTLTRNPESQGARPVDSRLVPESDIHRFDDFFLISSRSSTDPSSGKYAVKGGGWGGQGLDGTRVAGHARSASVDASTNTPSDVSKRKASLPKITKAKSKTRIHSIDKTKEKSLRSEFPGDGAEILQSPDSSITDTASPDTPPCKSGTPPPSIARRSFIRVLEKRLSADVISVQPLKTGFSSSIQSGTNPHRPLDFESALLALKRHGRQGIGGSVPMGLSTLAADDIKSEVSGFFQRPRDDADNMPIGTFLTVPSSGKGTASDSSVLQIRPTIDKTVIESSLALGSGKYNGIVRSSSDQVISARYLSRGKYSLTDLNDFSSPQVDWESSSKPKFSSCTTLSRPLKSNQKTLSVKVIFHHGNRRESLALEITPDTTPRQVVEKSCRRFDIMDDWSYAIFSEALNAWLPENVSLGSYPADRVSIVFMKPKSPEFLEAKSIPRMKSNSRVATTNRISPYNSLTNLFSRHDHALKSKIHPNCVYLSTLLFTFDNRILMAANGMLPTVMIGKDTADCFESNSEEFNWLLKVSMDWERPIGGVSESTAEEKVSTGANSGLDSMEEELDYDKAERYGFSNIRARRNCVRYEKEESFRYVFYKAVDQLRTVLNLGILGTVHDAPLETATMNSKIVLAMQYIPEADRDDIGGELARNGTLRWRSPDNLNPAVYNRSQTLWTNYARKFESRQVLLSPGLYLGMFHLESTMNGINILVPEERNTFIPVEKIRDENEVQPDEWNWLRAFSLKSSLSDVELPNQDDPQREAEAKSFKTLFVQSFQRLQQRTGLNVDQKDLYVEEVIQIDNMGDGTTFTMLKPGCEAFTSPSTDTNHSSSLPNLHLNEPSTSGFGDSPRKSSADSNTSPPMDVARVIFVIRPMRSASQRRPSTLDTSRYVMHPFPIFEALCHHTFNSIVYDPFRRTMLSLQETLALLRTELKVDLSKNGYPDVNERTLDEKYQHAQQFGALDERCRRTKMAMSILEEEVANLNHSWLTMNWTVKLIKWDRKRSGMEHRGSHYSLSIPSADAQ